MSDLLSAFFALIDLFAILPYYIELAVKADTTAFFRFSILRTFRLLRVFRPFRYSSTILLTIEVMILSTRRSKHALLALSFFVTMALVVFSTLLYFAERGTWDETLETFVDSEGVKTQFESIPAAAWFVLVSAYCFLRIPKSTNLSCYYCSDYIFRHTYSDDNGWIRGNHSAYFPWATHHRSSLAIWTITRCVTKFRIGTRVRRRMGGDECRVRPFPDPQIPIPKTEYTS
jgi:hypothetical protein